MGRERDISSLPQDVSSFLVFPRKGEREKGGKGRIRDRLIRGKR